MSKLSTAVKSASRRYKDVSVVLNGELAQEREALLRKVAEAASSVKQRHTKPVDTSAREALEAWDAAHRDDVVTIRVVQAAQAEWRMIQRRNPMAKQETARDRFDTRYGFAVVPAAVELLEKCGLVVDGDEVEKPTAEEWAEFFEAVAPGDMYLLAYTMIELHNEASDQTFGELVKA